MQKINLWVAAPTHPATGYGKVVAGTLAGLGEMGVEVIILEHQPELTENPHPQPLPKALGRGENTVFGAFPFPIAMGKGLGDGDGKIVNTLNKDYPLAPITLVIGSPLGWENQGWGDVYLYTMSESDRVSAEWVAAINAKCAGVLVTCPELVEIYRQSGVRVPVWDVGMGVNEPHPPNLFNDPTPYTGRGVNTAFATPPRQMERGPGGDVNARWLSTPKSCDKPLTRRGDFIYMTYSYGDLRKGAHLVVQAFKMLFGNRANPGVQLWIKARDAEDTWLAGCADRRIHVFDGEISDDEWAYLLRKADCFVFPSFGEGFGLPPREATLMGTPAIATGWLGLSDIHQWGLPVRVKRLTPAYFDDWGANGRGARWAEPDVVHLASQMRWVMANPAAAQAIAGRGREYLWRYFSWGRIAERICRVIPR